jgi:hypothetical protein
MHLVSGGVFTSNWQVPGSFENFSVILMKIQFFWDVTLSVWVSSRHASSLPSLDAMGA